MMRALGPSDTELVARVVGGDQHAFRPLIGRFDERLRRLASRLLGGDPYRMDDALQDAYVRAYRSLAGFQGDSDLGTWLYRITYNACIDELRRGRRRPSPVDTAEAVWDRPSREPGPERSVTAADQVNRALATLPDDQRAAVLLVDGEGLDYAAAAEVLGVAPGTIASRLFRARSTLRLALTEEGEVR